MDALFRALRQACSPGVWSRGVEIARADSVVGIRAGDDEVELQVTAPGEVVGTTVFLYPEDEDWSCECNHPGDACMHAAAAAIALRQARSSGEALPGQSRALAGGTGPRPTATVGYRLERAHDRLALHRYLQSGDEGVPLEVSLPAAVEGKAGMPVTASRADFAVDVLISRYGEGPIAQGTVAKTLEALSRVGNVTYGGKSVSFGEPRCGLQIVVEDCAEGLRARLLPDPKVDETFANGALRIGDTLHPLGSHGLSEREYGELKRGKIYPPTEQTELVGHTIPRWEERIPVKITAAIAGRAQASIKPRLQIDTRRVGDALELFPTVVYGDPAVARLHDDRLVSIGNGAIPQRDTARERHLLRVLRSAELEPGVRVRLEAAQAIEVLERLREERPLRRAIAGSGAEQFFAVGKLEPHMEISAEGQADVWFAPASGEGSLRADPAAVVRAWEQNQPLVPLLQGGFGELPREWLATMGHRLKGFLQARELARDGNLPAWSMADAGALHADLNPHGATPPAWSNLRRLLQSDEEQAAPALPADLQAELRPYQQDGVAWLTLLRRLGLGGLLADDMGLGKTLQALCVVQRPALVVAPASVLFNWHQEARKFRPGLKVSVYHGAGRRLDPEADLTLTTYAVLRLDIEQLRAVRWDTVILDEAQTIKNPSSQVAQAAYRLQGTFKLALTGTPVENRLDDLWSELSFANPGLLGSRDDFSQTYAKPIAAGEAGVAVRLRERVRPFVLRRLKGEVAKDLPPRTDITLPIELGEAEREAYHAVHAATRKKVVEELGAGANAIQLLEALLRLRQAACHAALVPGFEHRSQSSSAKLTALVEHLEAAHAEGSKALVFSQWTSMLNLVEPALQRADIPFTRLDGATRDREGVVSSFQSHGGPPVMLISLKAGGTGLNLTAADHVFLLDPWWNPAAEDQAADRAHRIGQDKPVWVYRLVAKDTVEERILALQQAKRELAEAAVGRGTGGGTLTRDELLALLD